MRTFALIGLITVITITEDITDWDGSRVLIRSFTTPKRSKNGASESRTGKAFPIASTWSSKAACSAPSESGTPAVPRIHPNRTDL